MSHARGIHSHCPEAPSVINVTQNIVELDGQTTIWVDEQYTGADLVGSMLTLGGIPYSASSILVSLNSGVQRIEEDFTAYNNKIVFTFTPALTDIIHVRYIKVGEGVSALVGANLAVGTMVGYATLQAPPSGWLVMNGTTKVYSTVYSALFGFLGSNLHLTTTGTTAVDGNGTYYTLKSITTSYYDGTQFVQGTTIIKT